jgi:acetolactate synthase small subunit
MDGFQGVQGRRHTDVVIEQIAADVERLVERVEVLEERDRERAIRELELVRAQNRALRVAVLTGAGFTISLLANIAQIIGAFH